MSNSDLCIKQRSREQSQSKKILFLALLGSTFFHGVLAITTFKPFPIPEPLIEAEAPIELMIIEEPKPEPKPVKTQIIQPTVQPQPQPVPQPIAPTPPPVQPKIEPSVAPVTTPPEPQPVLTSRTPSESFKVPQVKSPSSVTPPAISRTSGTATVTAPPVAKPQPEPPRQGITCLSGCNPEYPFALDGAEGSAAVQLVVGPGGEVISVTLIRGHQNSQINRQALLAARNMRFTPTGTTVSAQVTVNFTVAGSEFDRVAKERQQQLEQERQAQQQRQQQLEQERQAQQQRQQQLEQQKNPEVQPPVETLQPLIPRDAPLLPDAQDRLNK